MSARITVADRGVPRRGANLLIGIVFCRKLHENENESIRLVLDLESGTPAHISIKKNWNILQKIYPNEMRFNLAEKLAQVKT